MHNVVPVELRAVDDVLEGARGVEQARSHLAHAVPPVAQDRPYRGDAGAASREEQRAAVLRAPNEIAADGPADLERVARPHVLRQVGDTLLVLEPLDGDRRRLAGCGGERSWRSAR